MAQPNQSAKHILVVDDDTALVELICEVLTRAGGLQAEHVAHGEAALAAWKTARPDLLIVDYSMPGMSGLHLLDALLRLNGSPVPAIMISGNPVGAAKHWFAAWKGRLGQEPAPCVWRRRRALKRVYL